MKAHFKRTILALPLLMLVASCSPFKQTSSKMMEADGNRVQYEMVIEKKAADYLEIVEVKLINSESMASESASFQVLDRDGSTTLLNLKGYDSFIIVAETTNAELNADRAFVSYKDEPEGDLKSKKIEPLIMPEGE